MIKQIFNFEDFDMDYLQSNYYGRKLISYYNAYGTMYDFCRFYKVEDIGINAYMFQINATLVISTPLPLPPEEVLYYIRMYKPYRVEAPFYMLDALGVPEGYKVLKRTQFEFSEHEPDNNFDESLVDSVPNLLEVYDILSEGFPTLQDKGLWITDISHRLRRGYCKVYLYNHCTTATVLFDVNNHVVIGQVATKTADRGKKYARDLLYWLGHQLRLQGKKVTLFALDYRESFYQEIGFKTESIENVLQQVDEFG
jgi:hypothetical protein